MVTPDNVTVDKASKKVISRQTADKQVMTVRVSGGTQEQPVPQSLREVPVLSDSAAADLTELAVQIEQLYRQPMDIEWALADGQFAIVQARPITALPEFDAQPLLEWNLPEPKGQYMRASICELMSDPLSPLFASLGLSAIENGINVMAKEMFGLPIDTLTGFMLSINGYAYQKVSYTGRQWLQLLARMGPRVPRLLREGVPYWQNVAHPHYAQVVKKWKSQPVSELSPVEIWNGVQEIMAAYAQHIGSLMVSTMGPSAGSEGIFTQVYDKMVMRPGDPPAPAFLMGYDSLPIKAEKALYDLSVWCREQPVLAAYLADNEAGQVTRQLTEIRSPDGLADEIWDAFCSRFQQYLEDYGYSIYDMDFAKPLPLDDPEPILETLKLFISGQARDPYQRQQAYVERRQEAMAAVRARLRGFKRWAFEKSLKWAQSQAPLREDGIVEIGLGYPVLRRMLLDLGRRFAEADVIQQASDIFWLEQAEVEASVTALEDGETPIDRNAAVQERHALWKERKRLTPPAQLPPKMKVLGMNWESILAVGDTGQAGGTIKGVAASPGQVKGTARVLHGPADFDQMQPGDVLVAAITTPAWTPLFAMASAVVTDIGGPLSHGSIVAREYGIPAVLGTGVATKRIQSGQRVTVDGCAGVVSLDGLE
jgi:pyruvate,water dikinase